MCKQIMVTADVDGAHNARYDADDKRDDEDDADE